MKRGFGIGLLAFVCIAGIGQLTHPAFGQERRQENTSRLLYGQVTNRGDRPIANAIVYLKNTKTLMVKTFIAGQDGTYRFPALSPNIDYQVYAEHKGKQSEIKTLSAFDSRREPRINLKIDE